MIQTDRFHSPTPEPTAARKGLWRTPVAVFVLSLVVTGILCVSVWRSIENQDRTRFEGEVARTATAIRERVDTVVTLLDGTAGLFAASEKVTQAEFAAFVQRLQLAERYPGILGIGYSQRIAPAELEQTEAMYRSQYGARLHPPFRVWPPGPREEYHSIVFLQPMDERNLAAIGYDMSSEPTRHAAMGAARDDGVPRASGRVTLVQEIEPQKQAGFLIYLALYAGPVPADVAQRRAQLRGFVYAPLRVDDLLRNARIARQVHYDLYDGAPGPGNLLRSTAPPPPEAPRFTAVRAIEVAGRPWHIVFRSSPEFETLSQHGLLPVLVLVALATSTLLGYIAFAQGKARQNAETAAHAQRDAAEALHREHSWLSTTLVSIADAVVAVDASGRILFINHEASRLTGWEPDSARGRLLADVVRTLHGGEAVMLDDVHRSGVPRSGRLTLLTRDGRELPIDHSTAVIRDRAGVDSGAVIVMRDASERLRHEESLLDSERRERERSDRLQRLANATPALTASTTEQEVVRIVEAAARTLLDAPHAVVLSDTGVHGTVDGLTVPLGDDEGRPGVLHVAPRAGTPYGDDDRLLLGQLGSIAGIALRNARLYADLRENDRRKDQFLATLAHELRNPLAPIRTSLEILRRSPGNPTAQRALDVAERQTRHMVRLIEDLLDVSRISRGVIGLRNEPVQLAAVLEAAVETSQPLIEARGHALRVERVDPALTVPGDATRLAQVFANLLNNAATYTGPGGRIDVGVKADTRHVEVSVADTGVGIAPDMLERVFDLFMQAEQPGAAGGGLGIGLTLVRSLVELHGGTVKACSDGPGRGARFVVCLPLMQSPQPTSAQPRTSASQGIGALDVLVVDDNCDAAESLAVMLGQDGHGVRIAHDGPAALAMARERLPDVALLDIGLPGMSGHDLARRLRQMPGSERVHLIAITGWGQADDRRRALEAGFDVHMVKPVDFNTLAGHLRRLTAAQSAW